MEAADWNIVVLGHWNRAILTPNWIAEKVFCLPPGTPVNVLVPLDGFGPFQVEHGRITVIPIPGQLVFQLGAMTPELLGQASQCARNAISALPATPLRACGINIRFTAAEAPGELIERTRGQTEQLLSDAGYSLQMRRRGETVE
ncbi:MAG: hypothetical protein JNM94_10510, partial [Phycisphaerae bacterium]|nr:hypothetical protein [Phycisphaerae bacterium]